MTRSAPRTVHALFAVLAVLVAVGFSIGTWAWLGRPVQIVDLPGGRLECLSYTPASNGASPLDAKDGVYPVSKERIAADMKVLSNYTDCIRTYSMLGEQGDVMAAAAAAGIKVMVGIWIGADDKRNEREIDRALALANEYPQAVRCIVVGNEVLLRREMTGERLARIIRSVKARTRFPVTYADIFEFWRRNPVVAQAVDLVTIHVLPYWDDPAPVDIDHVQARVRRVIERAHATFPGKKIQIGEIGWPSAGRTRAGAVPSLVNEARFVREFAAQATAIGVPYNLIEAIDQPWKRVPEGTVGGFWGMLDTSRDLKFPLTGPVSEWPHWRQAAGFTIFVAALALGWTAVRRRAALAGAPWRWMAVGVAGPAVGATLWALGVQVGQSAIGWLGDLYGGYLMAVAAIGGALLVRLLAGADALPQPAPLAELTDLARRRARPDAAAWSGLLRWGVVLPATVLALLIAVDGRHRDFWTLAFWLPAVFLALESWTGRHRPARGRAEEGWIAGLLLVAAPFCVDALVDREALAWAGCCVILAAPWLGATIAELRRLAGALRPSRRVAAAWR
jgi:glucan 1,3-beta-glucosidase